MGGGRKPRHVATGLGDEHLRDLLPHAGNGLQQLDLMRPRLAGLDNDRVQLGQGLLDQVQPTQHRAGQPGMVGVEIAGQRLRQVRDLAPIRPFAISASRNGSVSPLIIAVNIARADTVFRLDASEESLMLASSNINSNRTMSRRRSPINCTRYRVNIRNRRISGGGTNDGANKPYSNNCAIHSASRTSLFRPGTAFMCAAFNNHTSITSSRQ